MQTAAIRWTVYSAWAAASVHIARRVNALVPEPYMDEIFHVPQAQAYCRGEWSYWNPSLTTPPGVYLVPALLSHLKRHSPLLDHVLPFDPCSVPSLRATNLVLSLSLPFLYSSLFALVDGRKTSKALPRRRPRHVTWEGLVVALMPMLGWWAWMFYTDLASVVLVLLSWRCALKQQYTRSASLGATALLFRQTNIVWLAFIVAQAVVDRLGPLSDPLLRDARPADVVTVPVRPLAAALRNLPALVPVLASYGPVFAGAVAFVRWNGGIVLGDKANHVPTVHLAQVLYFLAFAAFFFSPLLLSPSRVHQALLGSVRTLSVAHPFLLADNRHYAFYLWRRIINVHPLARYALAPGYFIAARLLWIQLARAGTMPLSTLILFGGATCAVLVPTPLLEPRYFLTPLLILRIYLSPSSAISPSRSSDTPVRVRHHRRFRLVLEAALYVAVQVVCVWLFLYRPFKWDDIEVGPDGRGLRGRDERELGRWQRFMW
ncbi:hypothetical protein JCM3774_003978 [Rhodotorula dairenensis]